MPELSIVGSFWRPAQIAAITGVSQDLQRDWKRRGYEFGDQSEGWTKGAVHDLAKLLFVKTLRDANLELSEAWERATAETVGAIVLHALLVPGAVSSTEPHHASHLKNGSAEFLELLMNFAASHVKGRRHVAGGEYFIFGASVPAGQYASITDAIAEADRKPKAGPHLSLTVVMMRELSQLLAKRAGKLATITDLTREYA